MKSIEDKCYDEAISVLKINSTHLGFSATVQRVSNYYSVWARDHSICSLAALLSKNVSLIKTAKRGTLRLIRHQSDNGQVPSYIEIENKKKIYGGLGSITSIDSNMWVLISAAAIYKQTKDKQFISEKNIFRYRKIIRLLKSFDSNSCGLLEVHIAGDWADVFNRTYHVLYDEVLYYQALKSYIFLLKEGISKITNADSLRKLKISLNLAKKKKAKAKKRINDVLWLNSSNVDRVFEEYMIDNKYKKDFLEKDFSYYQSHIVPFKIYWQNRFELFGNILAILTGVANKEKGKKIVDFCLKNNINAPLPVTCLFPPVMENDLDWEEIYSTKEMPFTYHNGGVWPFIFGFWIATLVKRKRKKTAKKDLKKFAKFMQDNLWDFNEYYHGKNLTPLGREYQAWSAAGYILAYFALKENKKIFFL